MSAGQPQASSFQVYVDFPRNHADDTDLRTVFYRDAVITGKDKRGRLWVVHLKGQLWPSAKDHVVRYRC